MTHRFVERNTSKAAHDSETSLLAWVWYCIQVAFLSFNGLQYMYCKIKNVFNWAFVNENIKRKRPVHDV